MSARRYIIYDGHATCVLDGDFVRVEDYDALLAERDRLAEALRNLQSGIARYLADPLRKKTCAHAEMFIEVIGEQVVAAISPKPTNHDDLTTAL